MVTLGSNKYKKRTEKDVQLWIETEQDTLTEFYIITRIYRIQSFTYLHFNEIWSQPIDDFEVRRVITVRVEIVLVGLASILPTFNAQLLRAQIPKAQKYSQAVCLFWAFGICVHKSFVWNVGEIDTCCLSPSLSKMFPIFCNTTGSVGVRPNNCKYHSMAWWK